MKTDYSITYFPEINYCYFQGINTNICHLFSRKKIKELLYYVALANNREYYNEEIDSLLKDKGISFISEKNLEYLIEIHNFLDYDLEKLLNMSIMHFDFSVVLEDGTRIKYSTCAVVEIQTTNIDLLDKYVNAMLEYCGFWSETIMPVLKKNPDMNCYLHYHNLASTLPDRILKDSWYSSVK